MGMQLEPRPRRPLGVTLIALLQIISGLQMLFMAIVAFVIASIASTPEVQDALSLSIGERLAESIAVIFVLIGAIALIIAIFSFVQVRGYLRGREWARRRGRKIAALAMVLAVFSMVLIPSRTDPGAPIWTILFNLLILVYLGKKRVRQFFR